MSDYSDDDGAYYESDDADGMEDYEVCLCSTRCFISVTRTERERSLWQLPSEGSLGTDQSLYT